MIRTFALAEVLVNGEAYFRETEILDTETNKIAVHESLPA